MKNKNIRLAIITASVFLAGVIASLALIAWIATEWNAGGFHRYFNAEYAVGLTIGTVISFACGYFYHTLLSRSITRYSQVDSDMPIDYLKAICKAKLLSRYCGYAATFCFVSAALMFALNGEEYIEAICLLMAIGFTGLFIGLNFRSRSREITRERFKCPVLCTALSFKRHYSSPESTLLPVISPER